MDKRLAYGIPAVLVVLLLVTILVFNVDSITGSDRNIIIIDFDHERAGQHVKELVKNGPRMSGTQEELLGAQYIAGQFEDAGLSDVHLEPFSVPMFEVMRAEIDLVQ